MLDKVIPAGLALFQLISVIILGSYFISRTTFFYRVVFLQGTARDHVLLILFFGALSIYGTMSGISLFGAQANVRDLGPIIGGLTCGPVVGMGAAFIGIAYRLSLGGVTAVPCCLGTLIAGISAGIIWYSHGKRFIGTIPAIILVVVLELIHTSLVWILTPDFSGLYEIQITMGTTGLGLNVIGMLCFSLIFTNYVLERKTREELDRTAAELDIARKIQVSFLPAELPGIDGYELAAFSRPARDVGGDFYDIISFEGNEYGFLIADVSGKSIPAAIFMGLSCTSIRASAEWVHLPSLAVERANNLVCKYAESGMFFSLFYGILDAGSGRIRYVNAGHPPPVVLTQNGGSRFLTHTGTIVGFTEDAQYREGEFTMQPGDILVCYTDGVTECIDRAGSYFGRERLVSCIQKAGHRPAEEILKEVHAVVMQFAGDVPQFDDITLLVIKRNPEGKTHL